MSDLLWSYLRNPFNNATKDSTKLMNLLAKDHHDKLKGAADQDAQFLPLYNQFLPYYERFSTLYVDIMTNNSVYKANTQNVQRLYIELSGVKAKYWDIKTQNVYEEGSFEHQSIFPNSRKPLQTGSYESRIRTVKSMANAMRIYPSLATIQQDVEQFGQTLEEARTKQQALEGESRRLSQALEVARGELAIVMHRIMGTLIQIFAHNPMEIHRFYDLEYLQSPESSNSPKNDTSTETDTTTNTSIDTTN